MSQHADQDAPRKDDPQADDDSVDRDAILARRRKLVTAALAGMAMQHCDALPNPFRPCLEPAIQATIDASPEITPYPCLQPPRVNPLETSSDASSTPNAIQDAATANSDDAGSPPIADAASDARAQATRVRVRPHPHPCLRPLPPGAHNRPHACLSPPRPCLDVRPTVCLDFKRVDDALDRDDDE